VNFRQEEYRAEQMQFRMLNKKEIDRESWNGLASNGTFFQTFEWADICSRGIGFGARAIFLTMYRDGELIAGMPAVITRKFGFRSFYSMPYDTYGELILRDNGDESQKDLFNTNMIRFLKEGRFSRISITDFEGNLSEIGEPFLTWSPAFTHVINLDSSSDYHPPDERILDQVRNGLKSGTTRKAIRTGADLDSFYTLYKMTEKRHGQRNPLYSRRFFETILASLRDSEKLYWNSLLEGGRMVGSCINFIHRDTLFNWQNVSDYSKRHLRPNHVLISDAIEYAIGRGLKKINLGASPPYAHSLIDFKQRWGGEKVDYDIYRSSSWLLRLLGR
jgi:CelD/BcsL family acetyltransferase involved in cellulose biosynthesis